MSSDHYLDRARYARILVRRGDARCVVVIPRSRDGDYPAEAEAWIRRDAVRTLLHLQGQVGDHGQEGLMRHTDPERYRVVEAANTQRDEYDGIVELADADPEPRVRHHETPRARRL